MARPKKTSSRSLKKAEIIYDALNLRKAGLQYRDIALSLTKKYGMEISLSFVYRGVKDSLNKLKEETQEVAEQMRHLDELRLGDAIRAIYPEVLAGNVSAIDRLVRIIERRARMYGYDAAIKTENLIEFPEPIRFILRDKEPNNE